MSHDDDMAELRSAWREFVAVLRARFRQDWWMFAALWLAALIAAIVLEVMP